MIKRKTLWTTLLMIGILVAACGGNADKGSLVIYSGRSENLVGPLVDYFQEETGVKVEVRYGGTAEIAATLLEEGENSPADIFFAQDPGGLGAVSDAGLLAKLPDDILDRVDPRFASPDGLWVGISGRARVIVYNTDLHSPDDLPKDLSGFTDPEWKGKIGLPPTNTSFQTMVTGMRQIWGEEATLAWLEGIMANEPTFYQNNTAVVDAVGAGEIEVGFVNHYYLYRFLAEEGDSFPARNYFLPSGGPGSLVMVAGAGQLVSSKNPDNAHTFLEYLLSELSQNYFSENTYEYPLISGIDIHPELTPLSELGALDISLGELADLQGTVKLLQQVGMLP